MSLLYPKSLPLEQAFESTFHGRFTFDDFCNLPASTEYTEVQIRERTVARPSEKLKKFQRFLNNFVFNRCEVNDSVVHSYRKGRNTITALTPHKDNNYIFVTDIERFFDQVTTKNVEAIIRNKSANSPIADLANYEDRIIELVTVRNSLPVGFPSSPPITNTHLLEFDNVLFEYGLEHSITYTRYSDDLILSSNDRSSMNNLEEVVQSLLHEILGNGYNLAPEKTKLLHKGTKIGVLGLSLLPNGRITVDKKLKAQLETLFHFYVTDKNKFEDNLGRNFEGKVSVVKGRLNYLNLVDPQYLEKLRSKYGHFVVDYFYNLGSE